jgi:hypothetical protein
MSEPLTVVEITSRRFAIPADCPCCGAAPDAELAIELARAARARATVESATKIDFPYCRYCVDHVSRWESANVMWEGLMTIGLLGGILACFLASLQMGFLVFVGANVLGLLLRISRRTLARHAMRESCSTPSKAVFYLGWSGTSSAFVFDSLPFAAKFAEQNQHQLVESPRIRKLLERYKLARIAVPTPATAVSTIPPPLDVGEWVARIAKLPGAVARRTALSHALDAFRETREREQLVRAVSAIEVAALLVGFERMRAADKQRHLGRVIEAVRYDNIPELLQQEMLRDLEDRLAKQR